MVKGIALAFGLWAVLVYGLPWVRAAIPGLCARWKQTTGVCGPNAQEQLARLDAWARTHLRPLSSDARLRWTVDQARTAVSGLEDALRNQAGDARVDAAVRGADVALKRVQALVGGESGGAREKLAAVPENAQTLLTQAQAAFTRLRDLLRSTSRRAEDVSRAVNETQRALDALSQALPKTNESPTPSP